MIFSTQRCKTWRPCPEREKKEWRKWKESLHALRRCAGISRGFNRSLGIETVPTMSSAGILALLTGFEA